MDPIVGKYHGTCSECNSDRELIRFEGIPMCGGCGNGIAEICQSCLEKALELIKQRNNIS